MTLDLEANEVEVKVLTSLASVAEVTGSKRLSASSGASLLTVRMLLLGRVGLAGPSLSWGQGRYAFYGGPKKLHLFLSSVAKPMVL